MKRGVMKKPTSGPPKWKGKTPAEICQKKKVFQSRRKAKKFARTVGDLYCRPYRCTVCDSWHLSTVSAKKRTSYRMNKNRKDGE